MNEWEVITGLLADATERPAPERRGWLRASGHPAAVIERALELLDAWEKDPDYLEIDMPLPPTLGPWRIGKELGAGGMGRVYEATHCDPTLERRVALKVIGGRRFAPELIDLFLRERAILAKLEHPHIARLYDTGTTPQGLPYFAMEFLDGLPLDRYMEKNRPGVRARVALLLQVCGAIAFAHRNLVVHGDIKPSNILVSAEGEARLLDFGIGRMLNRADGDPETVLTPAHASPEQLDGQAVTTASDVYQLGLLLQSLVQGNDKELAQVAQRCLEGDPARRYPSAEAVQNELQAWLDYRPLAAVEPSWLYLGQKFVRRHPWGTALAVAVILGTLTTGWQAKRANENRARTLRQFEETRKFSRAMLRRIAMMPVAARRPIVQSTVELLNSFDHSQEQDPVLLLELANAWRALGAVQGLPTTANLGDTSAATASYDQAMALAERARAGNERDSLAALCAYYAEAGRVHLQRNDKDRVEVLTSKLRSAVLALERFGPSADVAIGYSEIAFFLSWKDRRGAIRAYQQAVEQFDRAERGSPDQKAFALKRWGALLLSEKRVEEGAERYKAALAIERENKADPFAMSFTLSDLGLAERLRKRYAEALALYAEALAIREEAYRTDPGNVQAVWGMASTLTYMAWVQADAGRVDEAVGLARRAVKFHALAATAPSDSPLMRSKLAWGQLHLAVFLARQDAKRNAGEVKELGHAVELAVQRDPDANLAAELKTLLAAKR